MNRFPNFTSFVANPLPFICELNDGCCHIYGNNFALLGSGVLEDLFKIPRSLEKCYNIVFHVGIQQTSGDKVGGVHRFSNRGERS